MTGRTVTILTAGGLLVILGLAVADFAALEYLIASVLLLASISRVAVTNGNQPVHPRRKSGGAR